MYIIMITYTRKELSQKYNIPRSQWDKKHDDLLDHLQDFMNIKEIKSETGRYTYEIEGEMPEFIPNLCKRTLEQRKKDYEDFTIKALGTEFKPNSKSKIAREAISSFGREKYGHYSQESVVKIYVKEPFDKYGVTNNHQVWVDYKTYKPLSAEVLTDWRNILKEERIDEAAAAKAFYREQQGEDISQEKSFYKCALERFKAKYNTMPILVKEWRANKD